MHVHGRPDLANDNYLMGEIVRDAASRLHRYIRLGGKSKRSYIVRRKKPDGGGYSKLERGELMDTHKKSFMDEQRRHPRHIADFMYSNPTMSRKAFYRLGRLPGVRKHLQVGYGKEEPETYGFPHHLQGRDNTQDLYDQNPFR